MEEIFDGKIEAVNQNTSEGKTYFSKEYTRECHAKLNDKYVSNQIKKYISNKKKLDEGVKLINEWK